ncbi:MAG: hypothetical protein IH940_09465, partial [Acidobacteria bacterium]|nr:hypothetical protein [Acidobacteriota bacterium]
MQTSIGGVRGRLGAVAAVAALVFGVALVITLSSASAQQGPEAGCDGDVSSFPPAVFGDTSNSLVYPARTSMTIDLVVSMPAGTYAVNTVTYDGDENRVTDLGQHQEIISLSFLDAGGNVLATTAMTEDLADGVLEATGHFDVGPVTLRGDATQVRADHGATEP